VQSGAPNVPPSVGVITISGIRFAFGTSAVVIMADVGMSHLQSLNSNFGGPVDNGARRFVFVNS
jgi:putative transport protein